MTYLRLQRRRDILMATPKLLSQLDSAQRYFEGEPRWRL